MHKQPESFLKLEEIDELRDAFALFDTTKSGKINPRNLRVSMQNLDFETKCPALHRIIADLETRYEGDIDFETFLEGICLNLGSRSSREGIRKMFALFDDDRSGAISFEKLKRAAQEIGENVSDEELRELIDRADSTGRGEITFEDFYSIMMKNQN